LEQLVKFHVFYLPVIGGVVSYVLVHFSATAKFALLLPLTVSAGASLTFVFGAFKARELMVAIKEIAEKLRLLRTHAEMLVAATAVFALLNALIAAATLILLAEWISVPAVTKCA
jgi:hypothetical protein